MMDETSRVFQGELPSGERLLWSGQPKQGFTFRSDDWYMIPVSLLWMGFVIAWEVRSVSRASTCFALWGLPFILIGLYLMFGRFLYDNVRRRRTYYALTNERIIIVSGISTRNVKSLDLRGLTEVNLTQTTGGRDTITFGPLIPTVWFGSGYSRSTAQQATSPQFEMINNAREVYEQIRRAQQEAHTHRGPERDEQHLM